MIIILTRTFLLKNRICQQLCKNIAKTKEANLSFSLAFINVHGTLPTLPFKRILFFEKRYEQPIK